MNRRFSSVLLLVCAIGCASSASTTSHIVASMGGTVIASTHVLAIPAMALPTDADVTLETASIDGYPALPNALPEVLRIQPEGTVLEHPATVTIRGSFVDAPAGSTVSVRQLANGDGVRVWTPLESVRDAATGDLTVSVTQFQPLAVVVIDAAAGGTIDGAIHWGDGTAAAMVPIQLMNGATVVATQMSGTNGQFTFAGVAPGAYHLAVNFECMLDQAVTVTAGAPATVSLVLCGG